MRELLVYCLRNEIFFKKISIRNVLNLFRKTIHYIS